jgi:Na+-driven multidrug efflux pump
VLLSFLGIGIIQLMLAYVAGLLDRNDLDERGIECGMGLLGIVILFLLSLLITFIIHLVFFIKSKNRIQRNMLSK